MDIALLSGYISFGSAVLPLLLGLIQFKRLSVELKLLCLLCAASLLSDAISLVLMKASINNWLVANIFLATQIIVLFGILYMTLKDKWIKIVLYAFLVFAVSNFLFIQTPLKFNSFSNYGGSVILIYLSLLFLYRLLRDLPTVHISRLPMLWLVFAILLYFSGTLFLFLFNNYLLSSDLVNHRLVWILHNLLNLTKNLLFGIALWQHYLRTNYSPY